MEQFSIVFVGMHKKSIEASEKLTDSEDGNSGGNPLTKKEKDEIRTESINTLRAKAQQHSAKMQYGRSGSPELTSQGFMRSDTQEMTPNSKNSGSDTMDTLLFHSGNA